MSWVTCCCEYSDDKNVHNNVNCIRAYGSKPKEPTVRERKYELIERLGLNISTIRGERSMISADELESVLRSGDPITAADGRTAITITLEPADLRVSREEIEKCLSNYIYTGSNKHADLLERILKFGVRE